MNEGSGTDEEEEERPEGREEDRSGQAQLEGGRCRV